MKTERRISDFINEVYNSAPPSPESFVVPPNTDTQIRPNSVCIEDTSFGDSGKGRVTQEINDKLIRKSPRGILYSYRWNGTRNAGHEIFVNGIGISLHQLPVACTQEGATAILGRGMLIHPNDLVTEMNYTKNRIGTDKLPGKIIIDSNAVIITDVHSAYESFTNRKLDVGHGATGSGVAQGYSTWLEKRAITVSDFVSPNWREIFAKQYNFYADLMGGVDILSSETVNRLNLEGKRDRVRVGSINEYLDQLEEARKAILSFVVDAMPIYKDVWENQLKVPFTFEGAQGAGLDPYHGVYSDVTSSRPIGRVGIPDSTEGVIIYEDIARRISVLKTPYMSSVGSRVPPYSMDDEHASMYRTENDERGRSTGRDRGIYPIDLVIMRHLRKVSKYNSIAVTHLDSNHQDDEIRIVKNYRSKINGNLEPYRPYQWHWNQVVGEIHKLPSWDGKSVVKARTIYDLPPECLQFLKFLSGVLAPSFIVTNGKNIDQSIFFGGL